MFTIVPLVMFSVGIMEVSRLAEDPLTLWFGQQAIGRIEAVRPYRGWKDDGHNYDITFRYDTDRTKEEIGYGAIDTLGAPRPAVGNQWPIRYRLWGTHYRAEMESSNFGVGSLVCVGLFFGVWMFFVSLVAAFAWWHLITAFRLVHYGDVSIGVVTRKHSLRESKGTRYKVDYRFETPVGGERLEPQMLRNRTSSPSPKETGWRSFTPGRTQPRAACTRNWSLKSLAFAEGKLFSSDLIS